MTEVKDWLVDYVANATGITRENVLEHFADNYFDAFGIDSFFFIQFIADIEEHFGVRFSNDEFLDRHFATLAGVLEKITEGTSNE